MSSHTKVVTHSVLIGPHMFVVTSRPQSTFYCMCKAGITKIS